VTVLRAHPGPTNRACTSLRASLPLWLCGFHRRLVRTAAGSGDGVDQMADERDPDDRQDAVDLRLLRVAHLILEDLPHPADVIATGSAKLEDAVGLTSFRRTGVVS
jgi:hypothetical protein